MHTCVYIGISLGNEYNKLPSNLKMSVGISTVVAELETRKLYHVICNMLYGAVHRSLRAKIRQYWD